MQHRTGPAALSSAPPTSLGLAWRPATQSALELKRSEDLPRPEVRERRYLSSRSFWRSRGTVVGQSQLGQGAVELLQRARSDRGSEPIGQLALDGGGGGGEKA